MEDSLKLDDLRAKYEAWVDASADGRRDAEKARDYYDGKQMTKEECSALARVNSAPMVQNRIRPQINLLRGMVDSQRMHPKAHPRTPQHDGDAQTATEALRFVSDDVRFHELAVDVAGDLLIEGTGAVEISVAEGRQGYDVAVRRISWDRLIWDPYSQALDFSDAAYLGEVLWKDEAEALAIWPEGAPALSRTLAPETDGANADKPESLYADQKRRRVKIIRLWLRNGDEWSFATFTGGGVLEAGPSPYHDEDGRAACPILAQSAYVDREGDRYGVVRDMIGPQDEVNKRRSEFLAHLSNRKVRLEKGAVDSVVKLQEELAKPNGVIEVQRGFALDFLDNAAASEAQWRLMLSAEHYLETKAGPNAAMMGKQEGQQSGRAILAQQQAGLQEMQGVLGGFRGWRLRCYRAMWDRIRQFWTAKRWIYVLDDEEGAARFVALNRPVTLQEAAEQQGAQLSPWDDPSQVVGVENAVAEMDVDLVLDETQGGATILHEQFEQLAQMAASGIPIPPDVLIEASSLPNKRALLERMRAPDPAAQAAQEMQMRGGAAKVAGEEAKARKTNAEAAEKEASLALSAASLLGASAPPPPGFGRF